MRTRHLIPLLLSLPALLAPAAGAREVAMRDFALLREGMSEAEVLLRLGPYDHETVTWDHHRVVRRRWYYIPEGRRSGQWLTEVVFDGDGRVIELRRTRPRP